MKNRLYMAVTADKYELPICVEESGTVLAERLGITTNTLFAGLSPANQGKYSGKSRGYNLVRIDIEEGDEE